MEICVSEKEILSSDISQIKAVIDKFAPDSRLSTENENNISIKFENLTSYDLSKKLQEQQYKTWFKKLDDEYPYLPFFLNKQSKTLMFFIMGNTVFHIDEHNNINFDETSKQDYLSKKKAEVKAFCFSHNINPKPTMCNLISFEPQQQRRPTLKIVKIHDYLNKFRAITAFDEHRELVTWLLADEVPPSIKILLCSCIQNCPQPFFDIIIEYSGIRTEYISKIIPSKNDVEEFCQAKSSIKITFVFKDGDSHQSWNLDHPFVCMEPAELEKRRKELLGTNEQPDEKHDTEEPAAETPGSAQEDEMKENTPVQQEPQQNEEKETPAAEETDETEEGVLPNETPEETIARLQNIIRNLKEKNKQKDFLIEDLERALNERQRSKILAFFKGLFK